MSDGVLIIRGNSRVEWEIPDILSSCWPFHSSRFFLAGGCWFLQLRPKLGGWLGVYLWNADNDLTVPKTVNYILGLKTKEGIFEEKEHFHLTFTKACRLKTLEHFCSREYLKKRKSELLPSDTLTIVCLMERIPGSQEVAPNPGKVDSRRTMLVELETLSSDLKDLLTSERRCDFTIKVQGKEFRTHRSLLSARSSVFSAMFEHDTAEAKSGILTIPDCDPESFGDFLSFLYTGKTGEMTYRTAYHLYATAEKYDVQQLKSFCSSYLKLNLTPENVCDVIVMADRYNDDELLSSFQNFFNKNYRKIFLTPEWKVMLKNTRLTDKLLSEMASSTI